MAIRRLGGGQGGRRHLLSERFQREPLREGAHARLGIQLAPLRFGVHAQIGFIAAGQHQQHVDAHVPQHGQHRQLVGGDGLAHVQQLGQVVPAQQGHQALEAVVQPAHQLDVQVFEHPRGLAPALQLVILPRQRLAEGAAVGLGHAGHPADEGGLGKGGGGLEVRAQHLGHVAHLALVGVGDAVLDDDAPLAGHLVKAPDPLPHRSRPAAHPGHVRGGNRPPGQGQREVVEAVQCRSFKHGFTSGSGTSARGSSQSPAPCPPGRPRCGPSGRCCPPRRCPRRPAGRCRARRPV